MPPLSYPPRPPEDPANSAFGSHTRVSGWAAPVISVGVILALGIMVVLAYTVKPPEGAQGVIIGLAETLKLLAVAVVSYWLGSSDGSARKDAALRDNATEARLSTPNEVVAHLIDIAGSTPEPAASGSPATDIPPAQVRP